jgi:hypothetical protein
MVRTPQGVIAGLFSGLGDLHHVVEGKAVLWFDVDTNAQHAVALLYAAAVP